MRNQDQMTLGDLKAEAMEEQERVERLESQGLCLMCESSPMNPHVNARLCLDCYHGSGHTNCMTSGCPNSWVESFRGQAFCETHFATVVYDAYTEYLQLKSELEEGREALNSDAREYDSHPRNWDKDPHDMSDDELDLYSEWHDLKHLASNVNRLKGEVKDAMDKDVQVFPDEYQVFG